MKNIYLVLALALLLVLPMVSAYLPHTQNDNFTLVITSDTATGCNLTAISYPDGSTTIFELPLTKIGTGTFTLFISEGNYSRLGTTCHYVICTDGTTIKDGSVCREVTGNGKAAPDGIVIVLFSLVFLIIICFLIYELLLMIGHLASLDLDVVDLAKSLGTYFALLALLQLSNFYLGNPEFTDWILLFIKIGAFTHVIVPITGFLISITIGSLAKKKIEFGTKRIYKRGFKIGKL